MSIQGTIATKSYIKELLEFIRSKQAEGVSREVLFDLMKEKLEKDMAGWK